MYHSADWSLYPAKRISYTVDDNEEYVGNAHVGAADDDEVWTIRKLIYDVSGNLIEIRFADGEVKYNKKWSDKGMYTYI